MSLDDHSTIERDVFLETRLEPEQRALKSCPPSSRARPLSRKGVLN